MYFVITDYKVFKSRTLVGLNKQMNAKYDETEFQSVGSDKIITCTSKDLDFVQDKAKIAKIPMERLYKKDVGSKFFLIAILIFTFINFARVNTIAIVLQDVLKNMPK